MSTEISLPDHTPAKGIEEVFMGLPAEYVTPPGLDEASLSEGQRLAMLAGSPGNASAPKLIVKDATNGFLSYGMQTSAGNWLVEVTYFLNSAGQKLVAVNHVWKGAVWYSHALYFLAQHESMWMDRREGVVPALDASRFWTDSGTMKLFSFAPKTPDHPVANARVLFQLPRKGKNLLVLPPQTADGNLPGFEGELVLQWKDGAFGTENSVLDRYLGLPGNWLKVSESKSESFLAIPKEKDTPSNRMRVVVQNHALEGQIRLGSHPDVLVYEGYVDLAWMDHLEGRPSPLLVVSSTCGVGDCGFGLHFLEMADGKWVDVTGQVFGGISLAGVNAAYEKLPQDNKLETKLTEGQLVWTLDAAAGRIRVAPSLDAYEADEPPVLVDYAWDGKKFVAK